MCNLSAWGYSKAQKKHLAKEEKKRKKHQKKMARQQKGSNRRKRTKHKISHTYQKEANIRRDFAHKTSRALVDSESTVFVVEDLKVKNMTKKPKPKWSEEEQRYLPNQAKASSQA